MLSEKDVKNPIETVEAQNFLLISKQMPIIKTEDVLKKSFLTLILINKQMLIYFLILRSSNLKSLVFF